LHELAADGFRAGVIYADVPSQFRAYSGEGKQRSAERYYDTMTVDELKAMAPLIQALAAENCALLYWTSGPYLENAIGIVREWGFVYKTVAFYWVKTKPSHGSPSLDDLEPDDLGTKLGMTTRANVEVVLLAKRGSPERLNNDVHQVVIGPAMKHSAKPEEVRRRIERLYPGPYLELYGRKPVVDGWAVWGNEIKPVDLDAKVVP
jgi:N6-adenosine-specific RNA methylase IME4